LAVLVSLAAVILVSLTYNQKIYTSFYSLPFLNLSLSLRIDYLSWFFAIIVSGIGFLSILFSLEYIKDYQRLNFYYFMMLFVHAGMLGIVLSADFLSFYIFWEIMSWSTYLLISYKGGKAVAAGLKYIIMSIAGSLAMLFAIVSLYTSYGTLKISSLAYLLQAASPGYILFLLLMFVVGFGIKNAIWPLHTWLPDAHAEAVSPFSAVLSGVLVRMGMYGFLLIMYSIAGLNLLQRLGYGILNFNYILCWIGAITIVIPIFIAILQDDAKRLVAWSSIGHGGYMILGIGVATSLGIAGGIFHTLNYAICVALLFFVAGAIEHRTGGVRDLNELGGLIKRMPVTFIGALAGISGLIGVPLTNGFVSKWLIYKTLIRENYPFLAFAAFIGTWGTILYGYKFLHNIFLGQLPEKYREVKKIPWPMQIPMILLTLAIVLFGILPGIPLKAISMIEKSFGMEPISVGVFGMPREIGELNLINILAALLVAGILVYLLFSLSAKSSRVNQYDSYAAGSFVPSDRYQYSVRFYDQAYRIIGPYLRDVVDDFYYWLAGKSKSFFQIVRQIYTGNVNTYALYILLFLAFLIFVKLGWGL
ncbi:MAG: proton-conducting transporter membrane subunit, partial [Candidatus Aerophobetes bacterium]|nr:proton-conducting transporter membrane subunit [Candidatus Aerophobetes bacterium]